MLNDKIIKSSFGLESDAASGRRGATASTLNPVAIGSSGWSIETENAIANLVNGNISKVIDGGTMDKEQKRKASANIASNGIQRLVNKYSMESLVYGTLPEEVKQVTSIPAKEYFALKTKYSAATDVNEKFKIGFKMKQAKGALESALWSIFSGIHQMQVHKTNVQGVSLEGAALYSKLGQVYAPTNGRYHNGLESTATATYTDQIFIPKISAFNSWFNVASVIMPKVQKTKTVLNEICEIPVSTKVMVAYEKDAQGQIVNEYRREDLYAKMDMALTAPGLDTMRTRALILTAASNEFGIYVDLHRTNLSAHGNKPLLAHNEHIGPQIEIKKITYADNSVYSKGINDTRAGVSEGPALGQLDHKGKFIPFAPNPAEPNKQYQLMFDWDVQNAKLLFNYVKTDDAMQAIKTIELEVKMRDLEQTLVSKLAFAIREERTVLRTPEIDRYVLPIMPEEMDNLAERGSANHLNKLVEMTSEFTQHKKESRWIKEYRAMKALVKEAKVKEGVVDNKVLYAAQTINLNTLGEIRKVESIAYHLGNNLSVIRDKFGKDANTTAGVQLSMFTGTLNLNVISQCLEHITGDINEDSDAKFLGVAQNDRVRAITLGSSKNTPIQSIVVGTDKNDFDAEGWDTEKNAPIPDAEVKYQFEIVPTFQDENIQTTLFLETPTKVISGSEVRANEYMALPSMIIHEGYKFNKIRPAVGDLTITGVGFRALNN